MTLKAEILDAGDTILLSNLYKPWYLHCNEHKNVPIPIPAYDYSVINRSWLCDCQLQRRNELLHELKIYIHAPQQKRWAEICILQVA